jgi:hypothetical protein
MGRPERSTHQRAEEHGPPLMMNGDRSAAGRSNHLLHPAVIGSAAHYTTTEPLPSTCTKTLRRGPELPEGTRGGHGKEPARRRSSSGTGRRGSLQIKAGEGEGNAGGGRGEGMQGRSGLAPPRGREDEPHRSAMTSGTQPSGLLPLHRDKRQEALDPRCPIPRRCQLFSVAASGATMSRIWGGGGQRRGG